jgi:hypothetical protein
MAELPYLHGRDAYGDAVYLGDHDERQGCMRLACGWRTPTAVRFKNKRVHDRLSGYRWT